MKYPSSQKGFGFTTQSPHESPAEHFSFGISADGFASGDFTRVRIGENINWSPNNCKQKLSEFFVSRINRLRSISSACATNCVKLNRVARVVSFILRMILRRGVGHLQACLLLFLCACAAPQPERATVSPTERRAAVRVAEQATRDAYIASHSNRPKVILDAIRESRFAIGMTAEELTISVPEASRTIRTPATSQWKFSRGTATYYLHFEGDTLATWTEMKRVDY